MNFTILHLSDLHITNKDGTYPMVLKRMLIDIKSQCEKYITIIIVISGDIIDKANYSTEMNNIIIKFFKDLKLSLKEKTLYIEIVPGNHDKTQSDINKLIIDNYIKMEKDVVINNEDWSYNLIAYKNYLNLLNKIIHIFNPKNQQLNNTYYIDTININKLTIVFINIDTSWSAKGGEKDKGLLRICQSQMESLKKTYRSIIESTNNKIFTICIAHHPLNWLNPYDESMLNSWFLDEEYFNIDAFLCGHTHDRQIANFCNNLSSYITLVTGIGWDRLKIEDAKEKHRYSIYNFNLDNNICEVKIRKTKSDLKFDDDFDILLTDEEKISKKILIPISPNELYPYLKIPIFNNKTKGLEYEYKFVSKDISKNIIIISYTIFDMGLHMQKYLEFCIRNFFIQYQLIKKTKQTSYKFEMYESYFFKNIDDDNIKDLFKDINNKKIIYDGFISYLQQFCEYFSLSLLKIFPKCLSVRCHFRRFYLRENNSPLYITFCQGNDKDNSPQNTHEIRDVDYTKSLIECSFLAGTSLVYKHNIEYNALEPKEWGNFITIVPKLNNKNKFDYEQDHILDKNKTAPLITCAISTKTETDSIVLDTLNYMQISKIISRIIENFLDTFKIDLNEFICYLEKNINEGD